MRRVDNRAQSPFKVELSQRELEYKDHYIKEAVVQGEEVTLKHTKNLESKSTYILKALSLLVTMKYHTNKFNLRQKNLLNSKLFDVITEVKKESMNDENKEIKEENRLKEEVVAEDDGWKKKLKEKEDQLTTHFSKLLKNFKPSILV